MAFPSKPANDENPAADFRSVSDEDFARLATEDKFRHLHLGMLELTRTLAELDAATTAADQKRQRAIARVDRVATNDLCVACASLVGGSRHVDPHPQLQQVKGPTEEELLHCVICDAWWSVQKLGWGRLD
jgi:hypothetical protein